MGRPQAITDDEILAAARAVFLDKGVTATVGDVAARCHVGEATVFRRFPTKHALLSAALDVSADFEWARTLPTRAARVDIRASLHELAAQIVAFGRKVVPLVVMRMSDPKLRGRALPAPALFRAIDSLAAFFDAQIAAHRIALRDGRAAARILLGSIHNFVLFEAFHPSHDLTEREFLANLIDAIVGPELRPPRPPRRPTRRRPKVSK